MVLNGEYVIIQKWVILYGLFSSILGVRLYLVNADIHVHVYGAAAKLGLVNQGI